MRSSVVLPQPLGPSSENDSPDPPTATPIHRGMAPKDLWILSMANIARMSRERGQEKRERDGAHWNLVGSDLIRVFLLLLSLSLSFQSMKKLILVRRPPLNR